MLAFTVRDFLEISFKVQNPDSLQLSVHRLRMTSMSRYMHMTYKLSEYAEEGEWSVEAWTYVPDEMLADNEQKPKKLWKTDFTVHVYGIQ